MSDEKKISGFEAYEVIQHIAYILGVSPLTVFRNIESIYKEEHERKNDDRNQRS